MRNLRQNLSHTTRSGNYNHSIDLNGSYRVFCLIGAINKNGRIEQRTSAAAGKRHGRDQ